jgi:phytoene dehydrogenase-like protein
MKKVIIVGAGIAGLSAGIYARQSGFDVTIYESHNIPGGASTSWRRGGYLFEGGMHWLTGSSKEMPLNRLWREVGALDDSVLVLTRDPFMALDLEGRTAYLYRDLEKLRRHFLEISPEDKKEIDILCSDIKKFSNMKMPVSDIKGVRVKNKSHMSPSAFLKMLPAFPRLGFYSNQSSKEYASRYKSPLLRTLLEGIIGPDYSAAGMVFTLATLTSGDGAYPLGGSLAMASRMAKYFEKLGGTILYGKAVSRVAVKDGVAHGIIVGGETIEADYVIVTQDTLAAIDSLFDPPIHEPWAETMRETTKPMLDTFICLGLEADLSDLPDRIQFIPDKPFVCGGIPQPVVGICNYASYKGYAPNGCSAVTSVIIGDSYDFWKACKENGTYESEKEKLADAFVEILALKYPQTAGKAAVRNVATPLTYERYLGSFKGSWMSEMPIGKRPAGYPSKPEGISNLYFAGQRLMSPGGLPSALTTGRTAVQYLCKDTDTLFQGAV